MNYINSIAGVLLLVTIPRPNGISIDTSNPHRNLLWNTPLVWVIGYVLWNWVFIYAIWPELCLRHTAILLAAFFVALYDNRFFEQARPMTLGPYLLIDFAFKSFLQPMDMTDNYYPPLALTLAIFVVTWMIIHFFRVSPIFKRLHLN